MVRPNWDRTPIGAAVALVAGLMLIVSGCTYSSREPGLFGADPTPSSPPASPAASTPLPSVRQLGYPEPGTSRALPVLGQQTWVSGEGLALPFRIAIHAVRRFAGGTVLDWSVTPLASSGLRPGSALPGSAGLALTRFDEGNINIELIDVAHRRVYRPLTASAGNALQHCLCSPTWIAERELRVGVTTMLQVAYPALPSDVDLIDVDITTVPVFGSVPVTPIGRVPRPGAAVDLARPIDARPIDHGAEPTIWTEPFAYPAPPGQKLQIGVDRVWAGARVTSIAWRVKTLTSGTAINSILEPPLVAPDSTSVYDYADGYASGPRIVAVDGHRRPAMNALGMTTKLSGLDRTECLCTDMRLWTTGLQQAGGQVSVVTNLPALPARRRTVDINFPGLPTVRAVPISRAPIAGAATPGTSVAAPRTWTYRVTEPPAGWTVADWPSPLPNPRQMSGYRRTVEDLLTPQ